MLELVKVTDVVADSVVQLKFIHLFAAAVGWLLLYLCSFEPLSVAVKEVSYCFLSISNPA